MTHRGVALFPLTWPAPKAVVRDDEGAPDRAFVARARTRDEGAFRELFDRHVGAVYGFLHDVLRDPVAADEGTQEVFVRAYDRLPSLRDQDRLLPWLLGIARNVSLEAYRHHRRQERSVALPDAQDDEPNALHCELDASTPEHVLLSREAQAQLGKALGRLSDDRRAVLLLRGEHGLAYEEIARVMGWSLAKVKVEIHRARGQLRVLLEEVAR